MYTTKNNMNQKINFTIEIQHYDGVLQNKDMRKGSLGLSLSNNPGRLDKYSINIAWPILVLGTSTFSLNLFTATFSSLLEEIC